jgi:predicted RNA-binding protein YlqC (UPF0109 family)
MKNLVESVAKALVDAPQEVAVREVPEEGEIVVELAVAPADMGRIIGRQGRTARSLRVLVSAAGEKFRKRYSLEILE